MIARQPLADPPPTLAVVGVLLALFLARSLVTFPIEHVDAAFKYLAAADLARGGGLEELLRNHHTLRWSEVLPQALVAWVTGFRYEGLYLLPLLAFAGYGALFWRGLRPALDPGAQALLLAALFLEPIALQHTGQLLNPPFGVLYSVIAVTVLARPGPSSWLRVGVAGCAFFAAYGAHSTYLSFAAGGFAWLLFFERRPLHALGLVGFIAALMGLETVVFNAIAGEGLAGGRLEALADSGHLRAVEDRFPVVAAHELLTRWFKLPLLDLALVAGFLACSAWLALDGKARGEAPPFLLLCILTGGAYAAAITVAVVDLSPLRPIQPLRIMYLEPFMPYAAAVSVYGFARLADGLPRRLRRGLEATVVLGLVGMLAWTAGQKESWERLLNYRLNAFAWRAHGEMIQLGERFRDGRIVLTERNRYALLMLIAYDGPVLARHSGGRFGAIVARDAGEASRCVRGIRTIPLERNERTCSRQERRAVRKAVSKW